MTTHPYSIGGYYWVHEDTGELLGPPKEWELNDYGYYLYGWPDSAWRQGLARLAFGHMFLPPLLQTLKKRVRYLRPPYKKIKGKKRVVHPRRNYTRDQWITCWAALWLKNDITEMKGVRIPFRLSLLNGWRPDLLAWTFYLKYGWKFAKTLFHFFGRISMWCFNHQRNQPAFPRFLKSLMVYCAPDEKMSNLIMKGVGDWNLMLRVLNNIEVSKQEIEDYKPHEGFIWQQYPDEASERGLLLPSDRFPLDKALLEYFYNRQRPY